MLIKNFNSAIPIVGTFSESRNVLQTEHHTAIKRPYRAGRDLPEVGSVFVRNSATR
jgi:hypothetical protein